MCVFMGNGKEKPLAISKAQKAAHGALLAETDKR